MVKKAFFIALSALLSLSSALIAGQFSASVSSKEIHTTEPFFLSLTLSDSSSKEAPVFSALKEHFFINSEQKYAHTTILNGKVSSNIVWKLSLTPKSEGTLQIPSITIHTKEGLLSTEPITLRVVKGTAPQASKEQTGLNLVNRVSNNSPYKNEPFLYTALLTSRLPLYNVQAQKLQVDDAIVELQGTPKLEEKMVGRAVMYVVEFHYLITPLKTGALNLPPITIQGAIPQKRTERVRSIFDEEFESFAFMQGFNPLKTFTLMTEKISLNVQPAIPEVSPWLPAKALTLEEQWSNDQTLRVGEPFSRGFMIQADGLKASQLPHLEELLTHDGAFKVYADKPKTQEKMSQGIIGSTRQEHYTLIPQQAGMWELPEISINWWDSVNKEKRTATIPARKVEILPGITSNVASTGRETVAQEVSATNPTAAAVATETQALVTPPPYMLYGIIGALTFFLTAALLWGMALNRKITSLTQGSDRPIKSPKPMKQMAKPTQRLVAKQKENNEKLPDLNPT